VHWLEWLLIVGAGLLIAWAVMWTFGLRPRNRSGLSSVVVPSWAHGEKVDAFSHKIDKFGHKVAHGADELGHKVALGVDELSHKVAHGVGVKWAKAAEKADHMKEQAKVVEDRFEKHLNLEGRIDVKEAATQTELGGAEVQPVGMPTREKELNWHPNPVYVLRYLLRRNW
jgi:hypothetical protein